MLAMRLRDMADKKNHGYLIGEEEEYQILAEKSNRKRKFTRKLDTIITSGSPKLTEARLG